MSINFTFEPPENLPQDLVLTVPDEHLYLDGDRAPGIVAGNDGMAVFYLGAEKEQVLLQVDVDRRFGIVHYNNLRWANPLYIKNRALHAPDDWGDGWFLTPAVFHWIAACWMTATGETLEPPACVREHEKEYRDTHVLTRNAGYGLKKRGPLLN